MQPQLTQGAQLADGCGQLVQLVPAGLEGGVLISRGRFSSRGGDSHPEGEILIPRGRFSSRGEILISRGDSHLEGEILISRAALGRAARRLVRPVCGGPNCDPGREASPGPWQGSRAGRWGRWGAAAAEGRSRRSRAAAPLQAELGESRERGEHGGDAQRADAVAA